MSESKQKYKTLNFQNFYKAISPNITTAKGGILFFNSSNDEEDNAMPQKIQDLKRKSSIHSHFLNLKSTLIYASGLFPTDDNNTALTEFLNKRNGQGYTHQEVFKNASRDYAEYEQAYLEIIYAVDGSIAELYNKSVNDMRNGEGNEYGIPDTYYFSKSWGIITNKRNKKKVNDIANAIEIPAFNPNSPADRQILHIKKYDGGSSDYPEPSYLSADYWINLVYLVGQYVEHKFEGGYFLDGFVFIPSDMPLEEQDEFVRNFDTKHKGPKGKKLVFVFGNTAQSKPEFVPIEDALNSTIFRDYMSEATKQICFAHGASLNLLGLSNSDSFGSSNPDSNDINVSRLEYIANVIKSYQEDLVGAFNRLFEVNELGNATVLNETLKLTIPELQPTDTTTDERREIALGLPPLSSAQNTVPDNNIISSQAA